MRSIILIAGLTAVAATQIPAYMERFAKQPPRAEAHAMAADATATRPAATTGKGTAKLVSDRRGHYSGTFRINGKPIDGLVDSGASMVTLPESMARRLGFNSSTLAFSHPISTANGKVNGALVTLNEVEIGQVRVRDVTALVLKDDALSVTLIGNSFLKKLSGYSVEGGQMRLVN